MEEITKETDKIEYKLEAFEGPLDLLLHLIEKNKVSIYDIPIAEIADQYIDYVARMDHSNLDLVSDFLVMAATLLDIKARMLLPKEVKEDEEAEDPRAELVERLLEYKKYRYMSAELNDYQVDGLKMFYKDQDLPREVLHYRPPVDLDKLLGDLTVAKLKAVFDDVMRRREDRIDKVRSNFGKLEKQMVQISDRIVSVKKATAGGKKRSFRELLNQGASKIEIVVTFMAVLELIHSGEIYLTEDSSRDDIIIEGTLPGMDIPPAPTPDGEKHEAGEEPDIDPSEITERPKKYKRRKKSVTDASVSGAEAADIEEDVDIEEAMDIDGSGESDEDRAVTEIEETKETEEESHDA